MNIKNRFLKNNLSSTMPLEISTIYFYQIISIYPLPIANSLKSDYNSQCPKSDKGDDMMKEALRTYNSIIKEDNKIYHQLAKRFGLSDCAFWIIYDLRESAKPQTQSDLCQTLCQPKQTINSALKKLEKDGYIVLTHTKDQRSKEITLTRQGMAFAQRTVDVVYDIELSVMASLSEQEQKQFIDILKRYSNTLKEYTQEILKGGDD